MKKHESLLLAVVLLALTPPTLAQAVSHENAEPNGMTGTPTGIAPGAQVEGLIAAADDDAYLVKLDQVTRLVAWTGPGRTKPMRDTILELRAANGQLLQVVDDAPGRGSFSVIDRVLMPGIWCLVVRGANGDQGNYSLDVRADAVPILLQEGTEPNGDPVGGGIPTAMAVDTFAEGSVGKTGDTDWFELAPPSPQLVRISTEPGYGTPLPDPIVRLWHQPANGGARVLLATDDNGGGGLQASLTFKMSGARYWFEVGDAGTGTGAYRVRVDSIASVENDRPACKGSAGRPRLDVRRETTGQALELPILGSTFVVDGDQAPPGAGVVRMIGLLDPAFALPLDHRSVCVATVEALAADFTLANAAGQHQFAMPLPRDPRLRGVQIAMQAIVLDAAAPPSGVTVSNRLLAHLGTTW